MSRITTHVLDTSIGKPARGVPVTLSVREPAGVRELGRAVTDADGRIGKFQPEPALVPASYQLMFDTAAYFQSTSRSAFFERVVLDFIITDASQHYHVPVLLSPFGYTTYRGS